MHRALHLVAILLFVALALVSPVLSKGVVNGYCTGTATNNPCPLSLISNHSSIINSISIASYKLSNLGQVEACNHTTYGCTFAVDVEEYNANITQLQPSVAVTPLVFDNDGYTILAFRAMLASNSSAANIKRLVQAAVSRGYNGLSMDWEPSCWAQKPSECQWPTIEESNAYLRYLVDLANALHAVKLPLIVCADVERSCNCDGDAYVDKCLADQLPMQTCNCCAFQTWFNTSALCHTRAIDVISVMDTYGAPFNAQRMERAVQPWFDAGCEASRLSLGLLQNQATTADQAAQMMQVVTNLGATKVDLWVDPWTTKTLIGVWDEALEAFIQGKNQTVPKNAQLHRERKRGE